MGPYTGETVSILVSVCWTISAVCYEDVSKRIGSVNLNVLRLVLTIVMVGCITTVTTGSAVPVGATSEQWMWLSLSGLVGLFVGDLCLFKSYALIGARMSQLLMTLSPVFTSVIALVVFGEVLTVREAIAIVTVLAGIVIAISGRRRGPRLESAGKNAVAGGIVLSAAGALCQATGYVLTKKGLGDLNIFAATQIRAFTAIACFALLVTLRGRWSSVGWAVRRRTALGPLVVGTLIGPVLGISLSLWAVANATTGIAATLMALVPIFILVPTWWRGKERITKQQVAGSFISVGGAALLFVG